MQYKNNSLSVTSNFSIKKCLELINDSGENTLLVVDKKKKLIGTLSDGDIRRAILKNFDLKNNIKKYYHKKPYKIFKELNKSEILDILIKKQISIIPLVDNENKIIKVYSKKNFLNNNIYSNSIIIMAGGKGLRLRPLTNKIPKPLLIVNKKPIIKHIIEIAKNQGITNFYISINYLGHKIKKYLGNGSKLGVKIKYLEEKKPLGTAGSISLMKKFNTPIIVTNSDIISKIDFKEMIDAHKKNKSLLTIAAKVFYEKDNYGRIVANGNVVQKVIEKMEQNILINTGIYILNPKIKKIIKNSTYLDMTDLVNRVIKEKMKINVFPIHEKWVDYGLNIKNIK